ncbi:MAG: VOC family protein [Anaerolineae bacterium]|nr:VOC family protein [Anaerolineae bacterium]
MALNMRIHRTNTILYCRNWSDTVAFYQHYFDFTVTYETDWFVEFRLSHDTYLSIANASHTTIESVEGQGITLSWQVADVHEARTQLQQEGLEVSKLQKKWGALLFYLHDPEGHRIELWQPLSA